jgi:ProP effector
MNAAAKKRAAAVDAAIALFEETFPKAFSVFQRRRKPLKIGIDVDLLKALDGVITPAELRAAMRYYCGNIGYLHSLRADAPRIGLDGAPAGVVSESEAEHARALLARRARKPAARAAATKPAAPQPVTPPKRRLGLADLKAAAQQRKQTAASSEHSGPP